MPSASYHSDSHGGGQDVELRNLSRSTSSSSLEETQKHDAFDYDDPLGRRQRTGSDASSVLTFQLYTPDEERSVRRKLDYRIVSLVSILYLLSFLDRSSGLPLPPMKRHALTKDKDIGNAKIAGMMHDLRLDDEKFEWLLTAFYITYIGFEWMILLYHVLQPHVYISICVFSWGIIASLQAVVINFPSLLILRALLGVSEAAFGPGVPFYLSFFYRRDELAFRTGLQLSAAPLASAFAGSLAYLITKLGSRGWLAPWRLLFLVEGFPSVAVAVLAWSLIPDSPESAAFLTPRERKIATLRLRDGTKSRSLSDMHEDNVQFKTKRFDFSKVWATIRDPKCYLTALMFLNCNIAFSSMPVFLPTVLHDMGYSSISSQALSAPPFFAAFVVILITARLSDRMASRSPFVIVHALLAFGGYATIALGGMYEWSATIRYLAIYPACAGFFSAITIIITWTINNQQSRESRGTGMTILNIVGQCGPLIGTRLYPDSDAPYFVRGMGVCAGAMLIVCALAIVLRVVLARENRKNARDYALRHDLGLEGDSDGAIMPRHGEIHDERFVLML